MAQKWDLETARSLIQNWAGAQERRLLERVSLADLLGELELFIMDQQPASLTEAERLLELIVISQQDCALDLNDLCRLGGAVRNDLGRYDSRVEHSFAPQASGPMAGRA